MHKYLQWGNTHKVEENFLIIIIIILRWKFVIEIPISPPSLNLPCRLYPVLRLD